MLLQQSTVQPWLTPVRLASATNLVGTYFNGAINNGVGATLTLSPGALTIDSVLVNLSDRVLLFSQSNSNENGIYVCTQAGFTGISAVLQRSDDLQCREQFFGGFYVAAAAGSVHSGSFFVLVEPLPASVGINAITFAVNTTVPPGAFQLFSSIIAGVTDDLGGGGAGPINTGIPNMIAGAPVVVSMQSSSNPVTVSGQCTADGNLQVIFSADPGASAFVNFIALTAAQNNL